MNYRHAYHAGNFADVLKHVVLARVLTYLKLKPAPFRVVDTHAGAGRYDLRAFEADKTGEWRDGVARVLDARPPPAVAALLAPYLECLGRYNSSEGPYAVYPGSPLIALALMRDIDRLVANELHGEDAVALQGELQRCRNAKALSLDAYVAIKAMLPPKERRGLVLIDPPFEEAGEFSRMTDALDDALQRFASGVYLLWYPVKDRAAADLFLAHATAPPTRKFVDLRLAISAPFPGRGLTETGVLVLNPPFTLASEMAVLLPWLHAVLAHDDGGGWRIEKSRL